MIVTTEKDAVRLMKFQDQINELPLYVIPVQHEFLFEEGNIFDELTMDFIKKFKRSDN
jgi:tetraacyldisaccharide 4'-kinase